MSLKDFPDDQFTYVTRRVVWYAETGGVDGGGRGEWANTITSEPFPTEAMAICHLRAMKGISLDDRGNWNNRESYGLARIRKAEEVYPF